MYLQILCHFLIYIVKLLKETFNQNILFYIQVECCNNATFILLLIYMNSDITESYLNKVYDDMHREQLRLMNDMKTGGIDNEKQRIITKQISLMNTIMITCLRLRNIRNEQ